MSILADAKILYHLALKPVRGKDHAARMESFYAGQAKGYDDFRRRLLRGRESLYGRIDAPQDGTWVELGGGTGANLSYLGDRIHALQKVYLVDLCDSLLEVAGTRIHEQGWKNVETVRADATRWQPPTGSVDVVTFSYALTMIPDWFKAVENARRMLKPGGILGVVDFYVSRKYPAENQTRHGWATRSFWPVWFACDGVFPSPDHIPYLQERFEPVHFSEHRARTPYLPFLRPPYYCFVGRRPENENA